MVAPTLVAGGVTVPPNTTVTAGVGFSINFTAYTYQNTIDTYFTGVVTLTDPTAPTGAAPIMGTTSEQAVSGVATFPGVILDTAGNYVLQASSGNLTVGDSSTITVIPAAASSLVVITQPPPNVTAGTNFGLQVQAEDPFGNLTTFAGNVTVSIASGPGQLSSGTLTQSLASGPATYTDLTIRKAGTPYVLAATNPTLGTVDTAPFTVNPSAATKITILPSGEPPATVFAGQNFSVTAVVEDQYNNIVTGYSGTAAITAPGVIMGAVPVAFSNGAAVFSTLSIDIAGTYQVTVATNGFASVTSTQVVVTPALPPAQLAWFAEPPTFVVHGAGFGTTVAIEDQYGNIETSLTGTINVALDPANDTNGAVLGGTTPGGVPISGGLAVFSGLTINLVGSGYTLVATGDGLTSPDSSSITVTPIPPTRMAVTTQPPATQAVESGFGLTVTIYDAAGVADPDFNGNVTVAIAGTPGTDTLGGTTTVAASAGIANFSGLTLSQVGATTLQISTAGLTPITTNSINVVAAAPAKLVLMSEPPASNVAGTPFSFTVDAEDQYGNLATSFNGSLSAALAANAGNVALASGSSTTALNGVAQLSNVTVDTTGSGYTIVVTSTGLTGATTTAFNVTPAAATQLLFTSQPPATVTAGNPFNIAVAIADPYGNVVSSDMGQIAIGLQSDPGNGKLNGPLSANSSSGVATFNGLTLDTAASGYTIDATTSLGLSSVISRSINVIPNTPVTLAVLVQPPANMVAGADFGLGIVAEDAYGNYATQFTGPVTIGLYNDPAPPP